MPGKRKFEKTSVIQCATMCYITDPANVNEASIEKLYSLNEQGNKLKGILLKYILLKPKKKTKAQMWVCCFYNKDTK